MTKGGKKNKHLCFNLINARFKTTNLYKLDYKTSWIMKLKELPYFYQF